MKKELTIYTKKEKVYEKPKEEIISKQDIFFKNKSEKYSITVDGIKFKVSEQAYFHLIKQNLKFTLTKKVEFNKGFEANCLFCKTEEKECKCLEPYLIRGESDSWDIKYRLKLEGKEEL